MSKPRFSLQLFSCIFFCDSQLRTPPYHNDKYQISRVIIQWLLQNTIRVFKMQILSCCLTYVNANVSRRFQRLDITWYLCLAMKQILNDERYPLSPWISKSLRKRHIRLGNTRPNKCNDSHKPSKYLPMDCFKYIHCQFLHLFRGIFVVFETTFSASRLRK